MTDSDVRRLGRLRDNWVVLYHPNYFDFQFVGPPQLEGFLALNTIFRPLRPLAPVLDISCLNFVPWYFYSGTSTPIYDFCHVTRLDPDKGNHELVYALRETMGSLPSLTGAILLSIPGHRPKATDNFRRWAYSQLPRQARDQIDFITVDYDLPYPHSLRLVASLYRSSRIHLNMHTLEKHGRAQVFALASGMPVVGFRNLSELVAPRFRKAPHYFVADSGRDIPRQIVAAIESSHNLGDRQERLNFAEFWRTEHTLGRLADSLRDLFDVRKPEWFGNPDEWLHTLAMHYNGRANTNSFHVPLKWFLKFLEDVDLTKEVLQGSLSPRGDFGLTQDIEMWLRRNYPRAWKVDQVRARLAFDLNSRARRVLRK